MNLARPFKAGKVQRGLARRVVTREVKTQFNRRYATRTGANQNPALKRRAKLIPALHAEDPQSEAPSVGPTVS